MLFGVNKYEAENASLRQQMTAAHANISLLENRLEEASSVIETASLELTNFKKQIAAHSAAIKNLTAEHETKMKILQASVNRKVNASLASIGVSTFADESFAVLIDAGDKNVLSTFHNLTGIAQTEYYAKHREQIARLMIGNSQTI